MRGSRRHPAPSATLAARACGNLADIEDARAVAERLGIPFTVIDCRERFDEDVIEPFVCAYEAGFTPNPCTICNQRIKFGALLEHAQRLGCDYLATGHYARIERRDGGYALLKARDATKDQSYFLYGLGQDVLAHTLFPLGSLTKEGDVRRIAREQGFETASKRDSQGICFLGKINYNDFIERYLGKRVGKIVELETGKVLGKHNGYWFHTIGQRKGLGLSGGPWFVIKKDIKRNIIYVSNGYDPETQYGKVINMQGFDFITEDPWGEFEGEKEITFKIRHTPEFTHGYIRRIGRSISCRIRRKRFKYRSWPYSVIYDKDHHLCSGQRHD